jgi:hypothetical protein
MAEVLATGEFEEWFLGLSEAEQESVGAIVDLLEQKGVTLDHPHSSQVKGSRHGQMRELRIQHRGDPYRVFYCFDPRRQAVLLIGGAKGGDDRFYERMVPQADRIYDAYLQETGQQKR